jgi:hypothetical protein
MTVTWNPSDKGTGVTLSNGNLTAVTVVGAWPPPSVRATASKSAGRWYYEIATAVTNNSVGWVGWMSADASIDSYVGVDVNGWGWLSPNIWHNGQILIGGSGYVTGGDVIMVAADLTSGNMWVGRNGTWHGSGNPATSTNPAITGVTGTLFPAVSPTDSGTVAEALTANFSTASFVYTPPTGFIGIEETAPPEFVLHCAIQEAPDVFRAESTNRFNLSEVGPIIAEAASFGDPWSNLTEIGPVWAVNYLRPFDCQTAGPVMRGSMTFSNTVMFSVHERGPRFRLVQNTVSGTGPVWRLVQQRYFKP